MKKKLVWLGVLILGLIILSTVVNAARYGFRVTQGKCNADVDGTYDGDFSDFETEFFAQYSDTLIFPKIVNNSVVLIDNMEVDRTPKGCLGGSPSWGDKAGVFAHGYLYTLDTLTGPNFRIGAYSTENEDWTTKTQFGFYNIGAYKSGSLKGYLQNTAPVQSCSPDLSVSDTNSHNGFSYASEDCGLSLSKGVYFIAAGVVGREGGHIAEFGIWNWKQQSSLDLARFGSEGESVYDNNTLTSLNQIVSTDGTPRYIITISPLDQTDLNLIFKDYIENESWICKLAGGQKITDADVGITDEMLNSIRSSNPDIVSHVCCGNTKDEVYSFNYKLPDATEPETFFCRYGHWNKSTNRGTCVELINTNTEWDDHSDNDVYEPLMNLFNFQYFEIDSGRAGLTAYNGSDGCCGDDYPPTSGYGDYGYIGTVNGSKQFFCYDTAKNPEYPQFTWLNAMKDKYKIRTINKGNAKPYNQVDVISNSKEWYYCNANGKNVLNDGIPMPENGTFSNLYVNTDMPCTEIATILYNTLDSETILYTECDQSKPQEEWTNCCDPDSSADIYNPEICHSKCYDSNAISIGRYSSDELCTAFGLSCGFDPRTFVSDDTVVDKSSCPADPDAPRCLISDEFVSSVELSCVQQVPPNPDYNILLCNTSQLCANGTFVETNNESEKCCAGQDAFCKSIPVMTTQNECIEAFGRIYSSAQYRCDVTSSVNIGTTGLKCCFGVMQPTEEFTAQLKASTAYNSSFICFKQNDQDVISNCCYNEYCKNADLFSTKKLANANNKVQALGGAFHTLENFDYLTPNGMITDKMGFYKISEDAPSAVKNIQFTSLYKPNLSQFSYLEFDIEYDTSMNISINSYNMGRLSRYLTNGDKPNRRHHAVIPIPKNPNGKSMVGEKINKISFTAVSKPAQFLIDNIILTPEGTDLRYNSQNYYCTGGFEGWISDLDPPKDWTNAQLTDWFQYGSYAMTCNSQSAFGWTGTMCCGDDTKKNYGEFYSDSLYGCFNGTIVKNGWSMGYAKNYYESAQISRNQLENYKYAGIMYYNDSFIGCQISNHDARLSVSEYGQSGTDPLVNSFKDAQCSVVGNYYCMDGAWHNILPTTEGNRVFRSENDSGMSLKPTPAGAELIKVRFKPNETYIESPAYADFDDSDMITPVFIAESDGGGDPDVTLPIRPIAPTCYASTQILCGSVCRTITTACTASIANALYASRTGTCTNNLWDSGTCILSSCVSGYTPTNNYCVKTVAGGGGGGGSGGITRMTE